MDQRAPSLSTAAYGPGQLGQAPGDLGIPVGGSVLVAHRRTLRGVPETAHQLGERGAGLDVQDGTRVAEVVPAQVRPAGLLAGWVVDLEEGGGCHAVVLVSSGREQEGARVALGRTDDELAVDTHHSLPHDFRLAFDASGNRSYS